MNPEFQKLMQAATRLVASGDPVGATAAIQAALQGSGGASPSAAATTAGDGMVIDVQAREIEPAQGEGPPPVPGAAPTRPSQGSFLTGRSGDGRAQRDYRLYVPPHAGERPLPLVVMLHGCTQDPDDFARGTRMDEAARSGDCFVLYPAQSQQANPQRCWNWFKHNHQQRGRGEPALLAAMTRDVMAQHAIDPARVYVAGLSAGGAMAAILGATYPELYAAVGVHSGLAAGAANDLPSALQVMRSGGGGAAPTTAGVPTIVFHGDADRTVHPGNGHDVVRASAGSGAADGQAQRRQAAGGRSFTQNVHRDSSGEVVAEHWVVHGSGHAWSGGSPEGSYTDPAGPDATHEMLRFFMQHPKRPGRS